MSYLGSVILQYKLYYQRHLPHFQPPGATLFITFRLAGSLPRSVLKRLEMRKIHLEKELNAAPANDDIHKNALKAQEELFKMWESALDSSTYGPHWLTDARVASLISNAIHYRDGKVFTLDAFCLMPNHVHLVCTPLVENDEPVPISKILKSLKGYTARKANFILGRSGSFWQHESYDHVVRDNDEFLRIVHYMLENPTKAGLEPMWVYYRLGIL